MISVLRKTKVAAVRSGFESLTAQERAQFDNNFSNYVEFILNPENAKAAQDMGFLHAPIVEGMKSVKENQPVETNAAEVLSRRLLTAKRRLRRRR